MVSKLLTSLVKQIFTNTENNVLLVFLIIDILLLLGIVGGSAWITILFFLITALLLWIKLHDLASSFLLITIFSFQFYIPNKYYIIEVFKAYELQPGVGSYLLGYGVNLENIFIFITIILIIRNLILHKWSRQGKILSIIFPVTVSAILYFIVSLYSSLHFSPYLNLSITWLLQYMQIFFFGIAMLYVYLNQRKNFEMIPAVFLSSIFLQSIISIIQFVKQSWVGLPIESARDTSVFFGAPDAVQSFFRVAGSFGQSNQFSLILIIMLVLILPTVLRKKQIGYILGSLVGIATVLLTQSRSGWIALLAVIIITIVTFKREIQKLISLLGTRRVVITTILIGITTSFVVISRLVASLNSFSEGAGFPLRVEMFKEASVAIYQNPWVGYGIGTNQPVLLKLFPSGYNYSFPAPVHIGYIQLILESGILGMILFIFPFIYIVRCIINEYVIRKRVKDKEVVNYIYIVLSGIITFALFYVFQPYEGYREFCYLGIILGYGMIVTLKLRNQT